MVDIVTESNAITPLAAAQAAVGDAARPSVQSSLATRRLLETLPRSWDNEEQWHTQLRSEVMAMTPTQRAELIADLREVARGFGSSDMGQFIGDCLDNIERQQHHQNHSDAFEQLIELLYSLMSLMTRAGIRRNEAAAQMAGMSVDQARLSGQKGIDGAVIGLAAAVVGAALGVGLSAIALRRSFGGTKRQVTDVKKDISGSGELDVNGKRAAITLDRHAAVDHGRARRDTAFLGSRDDVVSRNPGGEAATPSISTTAADRATGSQPAPDCTEAVSKINLRHTGGTHEFNTGQQLAMTMGQFGMVASQLSQAAGGVAAAGKTADARIADAEGNLAQTRQRDSGQQAQRYDDQRRELFGTARSLQESNINTASAIAASMRA